MLITCPILFSQCKLFQAEKIPHFRGIFPIIMIQKSKCNQYFCLFFCFFLSIYNMSFFVISVLPYVVIIHYNFFTYILHNLPHFRCHSTFFRKNGEIYPSARHPSTTSKAQTNITFLSLPLSYTVNASK